MHSLFASKELYLLSQVRGQLGSDDKIILLTGVGDFIQIIQWTRSDSGDRTSVLYFGFNADVITVSEASLGQDDWNDSCLLVFSIATGFFKRHIENKKKINSSLKYINNFKESKINLENKDCLSKCSGGQKYQSLFTS